MWGSEHICCYIDDRVEAVLDTKHFYLVAHAVCPSSPGPFAINHPRQIRYILLKEFNK